MKIKSNKNKPFVIILIFILSVLFLLYTYSLMNPDLDFKLKLFIYAFGVFILLVPLLLSIMDKRGTSFNKCLASYFLLADITVIPILYILLYKNHFTLISQTIIGLALLELILIFLLQNNKNKSINDLTFDFEKIDSNSLGDNIIVKFLPNESVKTLSNKCWDVFLEVQMAWMNQNYNDLKKLCTNALYNQYETQLKTLEIKEQKNIMKNIELKKITITDIRENAGIITVNVYLYVTMYDYIINKFKMVVRGKKNTIYNNIYELSFLYNKSTEITCPNCGNKTNNTITKCSYCNTELNIINNSITLNDKKLFFEKNN